MQELSRVQTHPEDTDKDMAMEDNEARGSYHASTWTTKTSLYICDLDFGHVYVLCCYLGRSTYVYVYAPLSLGVCMLISMLDLYLVYMYMLCFDLEIKTCLVSVFQCYIQIVPCYYCWRMDTLL